MTCTWAEGKDAVPCTAPAECRLLDRAGRQWAHLCREHNMAFLRALDDPDVKKVVGAWVRASGGPKKLASTF